MSNYRRAYGHGYEGAGEKLTPRQRRRRDKQRNRDQYTRYGQERNPSRPKSLSGHPGRRREQLAEREQTALAKVAARLARRMARGS